MGIYYFACDYCGETFPDCGYYVSCESCGTRWCSDECANEDGFVYRESHCDFEDCTECKHYRPDSCKYCRKEDYDDATLLEKALELLKISREDLVKVVNDGKM